MCEMTGDRRRIVSVSPLNRLAKSHSTLAECTHGVERGERVLPGMLHCRYGMRYAPNVHSEHLVWRYTRLCFEPVLSHRDPVRVRLLDLLKRHRPGEAGEAFDIERGH